jgi:ABC-type oligopeptide transport system substrate-binding subunit
MLLPIFAVVVGIGFVAVAAMAGPRAGKGGTLRVGSAGDVDSLDPALAYSTGSWMIEWATCAKLFNYPDAAGAAGARVAPEVVDHYTVSPNERVYTFFLKRTFRFQTGAPVTAQSFADAFNRDANPAMASPVVPYLHELVGADAVIAGKSEAVSGVRVLAPYRLRIELTQPVGDLLARLTVPFFCPVAPHTPIVPAGVDNPSGSGPYYVASHIADRQIVLERNPYYRGSRPSTVDRMVFTIGETRDACLTDIAQNRIDDCVPPNVPASAIRDLASRYGINRKNGQFHVSPSLDTAFFVFNHDRPAFRGPGQIPLAKAINFALDRPALVRPFGYLAGTRADRMLPVPLGENRSIYPLRGADPRTARKWLARARFKPSKLVLYASASPSGVAVAGVFAFDLKQIGIDVDVRYFGLGTLVAKAGTRGEPFDIAYDDWAVDFADPAAFFEPLADGRNITATDNTNLDYLNDPVVNAKLAALDRLSGAARVKAWAGFDADLMRNDPPWAPFNHGNQRDFTSSSLGCFVSNPIYGVDLAAACKK